MFTLQQARGFVQQQFLRFGCGVAGAVLASLPLAAQAAPNGTWLSKPQIWFHSSNQTLDLVMERIKKEQYDYVFLDYRHVDDEMQQQVSASARKHDLKPIVWIQSPQYRSMTVADMIDEARHADGIQVDDHFFTHYSQRDFQKLRAQYDKTLLCSIQPFQAGKVPPSGCDQLDVQCYTPASFYNCLSLANRLDAVLSLSHTSTISRQGEFWGRSHNVFLWPHTNDYVNVPSTLSATSKTVAPTKAEAVQAETMQNETAQTAATESAGTESAGTELAQAESTEVETKEGAETIKPE